MSFKILIVLFLLLKKALLLKVLHMTPLLPTPGLHYPIVGVYGLCTYELIG